LEISLPPISQLLEWVRVAAGRGVDRMIRIIVTRGSPTHGQASRVRIMAEPVNTGPAELRLMPIGAPWHSAGRKWKLPASRAFSADRIWLRIGCSLYRTAILPQMIDTAILGLLHEDESHGYGIRGRLIDMGFWRISFGSIYPALRRLQKAQAIESADIDPKGRKIHRLTQRGRDILRDQMIDSDSIDNSSAFRVRINFLDLLPSADRVEVLTHRCELLKSRIASIDTKNTKSRYALSEKHHRINTMKHDIEWLEGLIDTEGTQ